MLSSVLPIATSTVLLGATDGRRGVALRWPRRVGAPSPNFSPSFVPHLSVAASFPFTTFERLFPSFVAPFLVRRRLAAACPFVRSIVTVLSSLTACPSARPPVRRPSIRWADGHVQQARARVHCAASHHRVKGSIFPPSILDVMGRKAGGARETVGRAGRACMYA